VRTRRRTLFRVNHGYQGLFGVKVSAGAQTINWLGIPTSAGHPITIDNISGPSRIRSLYCATGIVIADAGKNWTTKVYSGQPTGGSVESTVTISMGSTGFTDGEDTTSDHIWLPGDAVWIESVWDVPSSDYAWVVAPFTLCVTWEAVL